MDHEPTYEITIIRTDESVRVDESLLRRAVEAALTRHDKSRARISIALIDDRAMSRLNRAFLNHEGPTDVLTYDLRDDPDDEDRIDGEIVMSIDTARRESSRRGHGLDAELALYAAHGVLHLLGYRDEEETSADKMHALEDEILCSIGLGAVYREGSK